MSDDDDDETTFMRIERSGAAEDPVLSRAAFQLHSFGMMNSFEYESPGFVPDDYLNAISAETTLVVAELEAAGLWLRSEFAGGYVILDREMVKMAVEAKDAVQRMADEEE